MLAAGNNFEGHKCEEDNLYFVDPESPAITRKRDGETLGSYEYGLGV